MHTHMAGSPRNFDRVALRFILLLSLAALFAVAGCGSKSSSTGDQGSTPAPATDAGGSAVPSAETPASTPPGPGDAERGQAVYLAKACATCHKADGAGGVKLTGNPSPSWRDKVRMAALPDDSLRSCITNGKAQSGMVAWGKTGQVTPQQIEDLIAYIRTFSK